MITITQTCDRCGATRELRIGHYGQPRSVRDAGRKNGWREVREDRHLCDACIKGALDG